MRIKIIRIVIIVSFLIVCAELFFVQVIRGNYFYKLSTNNRIRAVHLEGFRGRIFDRHGDVLADNRTAYNLLVTAQDINDKNELFAFLGDLFGRDANELTEDFARKKITNFVPVVVAEDLSKEEAIVLEENRYRFPSIYVQTTFKRVYPKKNKGAHVLGYVGRINSSKINKLKEYGYSSESIIGYSGIEEYYDTYLQGRDGGLQIEVNNQGRQVRLLSFKEPTKGIDLALTVDSKIQSIAHELLEGKQGSIVIMDNTNGEILGMISAPYFNPNYMVEKKYKKRMVKMLSNQNSPFLNRAITGRFPPGSVFKVPVAVCALQSKKLSPHTTFDCKGFYELGGTKFGCPHVHASQNLTEAIAHSCNVYFYNTGRILGADLIAKTAGLLGLGEKTNIDLPYESLGHIPSKINRLKMKRKHWYTGHTLNMAIGQGDVLSTPLQLVNMMAIVANEGKKVIPHIVKSIDDQEVSKLQLTEVVKIDQKVFVEVKKGLRATVVDFTGTAHILNLDQLTVAGKTGTAQTSGDQESHAWVVGYAQGTLKNVSFGVFLEHGGSSQNANLVARQLLMQMHEQKIL